jgi:hypothetical protein
MSRNKKGMEKFLILFLFSIEMEKGNEIILNCPSNED